ncbi:hypothetical protein Hanom_Chr03g00181681 [Helianthus anomalus]
MLKSIKLFNPKKTKTQPLFFLLFSSKFPAEIAGFQPEFVVGIRYNHAIQSLRNRLRDIGALLRSAR